MIKTDGADLNPAVAIKVKKVTTSAVQAGWIIFLDMRCPLLAQ